MSMPTFIRRYLPFFSRSLANADVQANLYSFTHTVEKEKANLAMSGLEQI